MKWRKILYFRNADNPPTTPITIPTIRKSMAMVLTPPGASVISPKYMMPMAAVTSNIPNSIALLPIFSPIRSPRTGYAFSYRRDFKHDCCFGIEKINKPAVRVKHFQRYKYFHIAHAVSRHQYCRSYLFRHADQGIRLTAPFMFRIIPLTFGSEISLIGRNRPSAPCWSRRIFLPSMNGGFR